MKGRREEAECIIRIDQMDDCAYICVSMWPAMYRKMLKRYGLGLDSKGNSCRWKVPIRSISFRSPEKKAGKVSRTSFPVRKHGVEATFDPASGDLSIKRAW